MSYLQPYYAITHCETAPGVINADLELNPEHEIFAGHFPGHPVLPGVCMIEIVKELAEKALDKETRLVAADRIKFLALVDPTLHARLRAEIQYEMLSDNSFAIKSKLFIGETLCFTSTVTLESKIP
jgi:3-hydroxyacyl-[acyl-carrier-protein] dehydratase